MIFPLVWSGMVKSPTIIVLLSISPLCLLVFVLCTEVLLCWVHRYLQLCLPLGLIPYHYVVSSLTSCNLLYFRVYLSDMRIATPAFFCFPYAWNIFFYPLTFNLCVFRSEVDFLQIAYIYQSVFVSIQPVCVFWWGHLFHLHLK